MPMRQTRRCFLAGLALAGAAGHDRLHALRLHENGTIKPTPQAISVDGADWQFSHETKRELKA
jgi:hypothetical protein